MQNINSSKNIVIIDYEMSNLFSVVRACQKVGFNPVVTNDHKMIKKADAIILPGVGAFSQAMKNLIKLDLINPILNHVKMGKPIMGVCLGMQLFFEKSQEFGNHPGLGLIKGDVIKFRKNSKFDKVPQIGWNRIKFKKDKENKFFNGLSSINYMYFVHSFYVVPTNKKVVFSTTDYNGVEYCSSILKDNIFATQFHPEKSGELGLLIYKNWLKKI